MVTRGLGLLIDVEDEDLRERVEQAGALCGYRVSVAAPGSDVAAECAQQGSQVVVVGTSGELQAPLAALRALPHGNRLYVIALVARDDPHAAAVALSKDASDYILVPTSISDFQNRLLVAERHHLDTERRFQAESTLLQNERMTTLGTLSAGVAHELNNPLGYVLTNLRVLYERLEQARKDAPELEWDEIRVLLNETREGAERMKNIVQDLKTFSKADEHKREPIDVARTMGACLKIARSETRHRARVVEEYQAVSPVEASENRLGQVFLNLVVNAAQAMPTDDPEANEIRIRIYQEGSNVFVEVSDTGKGMPETQTKRIFEPFFTTKPSGTGLGLPIAYGIVQDLGGEIRVDSVEGKGTTFTVRLPASEARRPRLMPATLPPPPRLAPGAASRILVIDDEPLVSNALKRALRDHEVVVMNSGREAIDALLLGETFDVILCDLMMPEVSGPQVYDTTKLARPELCERFVFMSGGAYTPETRSFLERVSNPRVEKPFDIHALRALVRTHGTGPAGFE